MKGCVCGGGGGGDIQLPSLFNFKSIELREKTRETGSDNKSDSNIKTLNPFLESDVMLFTNVHFLYTTLLLY